MSVVGTWLKAYNSCWWIWMSLKHVAQGIVEVMECYSLQGIQGGQIKACNECWRLSRCIISVYTTADKTAILCNIFFFIIFFPLLALSHASLHSTPAFAVWMSDCSPDELYWGSRCVWCRCKAMNNITLISSAVDMPVKNKPSHTAVFLKMILQIAKLYLLLLNLMKKGWK